MIINFNNFYYYKEMTNNIPEVKSNKKPMLKKIGKVAATIAILTGIVYLTTVFTSNSNHTIVYVYDTNNVQSKNQSKTNNSGDNNKIIVIENSDSGTVKVAQDNSDHSRHSTHFQWTNPNNSSEKDKKEIKQNEIPFNDTPGIKPPIKTKTIPVNDEKKGGAKKIKFLAECIVKHKGFLKIVATKNGIPVEIEQYYVWGAENNNTPFKPLTEIVVDIRNEPTSAVNVKLKNERWLVDYTDTVRGIIRKEYDIFINDVKISQDCIKPNETGNYNYEIILKRED